MNSKSLYITHNSGVRVALLMAILLSAGCGSISQKPLMLTDEQVKSGANSGYLVFVFSPVNGSEVSPSESSSSGKEKVFSFLYMGSTNNKLNIDVTSKQSDGKYILHLPKYSDKKIVSITTSIDTPNGSTLLFLDEGKPSCITINGWPIRLKFYSTYYDSIATMTPYFNDSTCINNASMPSGGHY
jgi:hypothetical protein